MSFSLNVWFLTCVESLAQDHEGEFDNEDEMLYRSLGLLAAGAEGLGDEDGDDEGLEEDELEGDLGEEEAQGESYVATPDTSALGALEAAMAWARSGPEGAVEPAADEYTDDDDVGYRRIQISDAEFYQFAPEHVIPPAGKNGRDLVHDSFDLKVQPEKLWRVTP